TRPRLVSILVKVLDTFDRVDRCFHWPGDDLDPPGPRGVEKLVLPLDQDRKIVEWLSRIRGWDPQAGNTLEASPIFRPTATAMGRQALDAAQPEQSLPNLVVTDLERLAVNLLGDLNLEGTHLIGGAEFAIELEEAPVEGRTEHMVLQPPL